MTDNGHLRRPDCPPSDSADTIAAQPILDGLLEELRARWRSGERPTIESYLDNGHGLDDEAAALLVYEEYRIRKQLGETATLEDYQTRFPQFAERLSLFTLLDDVFGPTTDENEPGTLPTVPGYDLLAELGRGGMGVVYKATHRRLGRIVALKMLHAHRATEAEFLQRFRAEATAAAQLRHPNIVTLYEIGENQGQPFLTMEYVAGTTLAQRLAEAPLTADDAALLIERIARAAHCAHQCGVVHRDLKPLNILLEADLNPKIVDFGLAKRLDSGTNTGTNHILGTPSYMAPEAVNGGNRPTSALDVYALGAILYECLTGRPPFKAANALETLAQVKEQEPASPSQLNRSVPRDLATICLKCLAKDPAERFASAADLADDLGRFQRGEPIRARPVGLLGRLRRWSRRKPMLAGLLLLLAVVVAVSGFGLTVLWRQAEDSATRADRERTNAEHSEKDANALLADFIRLGQDAKPANFAASHARELELLRRAETHCRNRIVRRGEDRETQAILVDVYARLALLYLETMSPGDAEACLHEAETVQALLPPDVPGKPDTLRRLAKAYDELGVLCVDRALSPEAVRAFERSHALWLRLAEERSTLEDRMALEVSRVRARMPQAPANVNSHQLARLDKAVRECLEARQAQDSSPAVSVAIARITLFLGECHDLANHTADAERFWQIAQEAAAKACDDPGGTSEAEYLRAKVCFRLIGRPAREPYYSEAVRRFESIIARLSAEAERDPTNLPVQYELLDNLRVLAMCHTRVGNIERQTQAQTRAVKHFQRIVENLSGAGQEIELVDKLIFFGRFQNGAIDPAPGLVLIRRAGVVLDQFTKPYPEDSRLREFRATRLSQVAFYSRRAGAPQEEVMPRAEESRQLLEELIRESPDRLDLKFNLYETYEQIGKAHTEAYRPTDAVKAWLSGVALLRDLVKRAPNVDLYRQRLSERSLRLGRHFRKQGHWAEAECWFLQQEELWPDDSLALLAVAHELDELAKAVGAGRQPLTPDEDAERRRYLAGSERVRQSAEKAASLEAP